MNDKLLTFDSGRVVEMESLRVHCPSLSRFTVTSSVWGSASTMPPVRRKVLVFEGREAV